MRYTSYSPSRAWGNDEQTTSYLANDREKVLLHLAIDFVILHSVLDIPNALQAWFIVYLVDDTRDITSIRQVINKIASLAVSRWIFESS